MKQHMFISIPRTGTNSVRKSLGIKKLGITNHRTARFLRDHVGAKRWESMLVFSFVRNPYDRLVSYFRFCKTIWKNLSVNQRAPYEGNFKQWVARGCPSHFSKTGLETPIHMWNYLLDDDGQLLTDYVGKVESFNKDFKTLCTKLGAKPKKLVHINNSLRIRNYRSYYDEGTRKLAEQICGKDAELFGYVF